MSIYACSDELIGYLLGYKCMVHSVYISSYHIPINSLRIHFHTNYSTAYNVVLMRNTIITVHLDC